MTSNKPELFSAEEFVKNLKSEGSKILVTNTSSCRNDELPSYYDETMFKRGQSFYRKHLAAFLFAKMCGLISLLSDPIGIKIMHMTKKSSVPETAYRRYVRTILHLKIWYEEDFLPGSKLWKSIKNVNMQHEAASVQAGCSGLVGINQFQMAGTQFGFMGYILIRTKEMGIHNASDEELKAFVHFWRVIGYTMGIEDRFNLCRESLSEAEQVCEEMLNALIKPSLLLKDPLCLKMQFAVVKAVNMIISNLSTKAWLNFIYILNGIPDDAENGVYFKLPITQWLILRTYIHLSRLMKYNLVRIFFNTVMRLTLWLTEFYLILARFKIGEKYSNVNVLRN